MRLLSRPLKRFLLGAPVVVVVGLSRFGVASLEGQRPPVTFTRDIAPIVFENCSSCHRPGEAAPFSLLSYTDVKQRARLIADVTRSHYMPPWQPDSESSEFEGDRRLSVRQIDTFQRWVDEGAQEGDPEDLPPLPRQASGWRLGTPDIVITMDEAFDVPADGPDVFRNFVLPVSSLTERKYVRALEFRPGNGRVLHHARILLDETAEVRRLDAPDGLPGFPGMDVPGAHFPDGHFLGWAPGKMPDVEAYPWPLEPGTDLVVQMHLKPTGQPEKVQSSIALYLTDTPPSAVPLLVRLGSKTIDIPAGSNRHEVVDSYVLPIDVTVISVYPHAHYLGKEMTITARQPGNGVETLLRIPRWDFNWQDSYRFRRPISLKKGTTLQMRYVYDNSAENPRNPSQPPRRVTFGSETTDEMGELLVQVLPKRPQEINTIRADVIRKNLSMDIAGEEKRLKDVPDDHETRNALGVAYMKAGRKADAIREFDAILRAAPGFARAYYNLATVAMGEQRYADALTFYEKALALRPDYAEAHNNLGVLLEAAGQHDAAFRHFTQALEARPMHAAAHNNLGRMLLAQGQGAEAVEHFQAALRTNPESGDALYQLGRAQAAADRPRDAVQTWKRALAAHTETVPMLVEMASLLASDPRVRDTGTAVDLAERVNKSTGNGSPSALMLLAFVYGEDGRLPLAQRTYERALQRAVSTNEEPLVREIQRRLELLQQATEGGAEFP